MNKDSTGRSEVGNLQVTGEHNLVLQLKADSHISLSAW